MSEYNPVDPPQEVGGVPVDDTIGSLPPVDEEAYGDPRKPKVYPKAPGKTRTRWPFLLIAGCMGFCCLCWLACCAVVIALSSAAAIVANNEVTASGSDQMVIETDAVITLTVHNPLGQVNIRPGDSDEIKIDYTKKAYGLTRTRAQDGLDALDVVLANGSESDQFTITVDKSARVLHMADHVNMTVYVPRDVHLTVTTSTNPNNPLELGEITVQNINAHSLNLSTNGGPITFEGSLEPDASARFQIETGAGAIIVRLPATIDARLDAQVDTGSIEIAPDFRAVRAEYQDLNGPDQSWQGTLGEGSGNAPKLTLRSGTGTIVVDTQ